MEKRTFIKNALLLGLGASPTLKLLSAQLEKYEHLTPEKIATEGDFWATIRKGYKLNDEYINLENGYYCFMPEETFEAYLKHVKEVNFLGSYYMRKMQHQNYTAARQSLAKLAKCDIEELVITRNTTESLDLVIGGIHWEKGDEAIMAEQDYGAMLDMFKLQEKRYGIVNKIISLPNNPKSDEEIVQLYENAITSKTKLLMVCHMVNITGQILPVRKICDMAHARGVEVMVDGAHSFAHIKTSMKDLDCDYYGTSLHKWLSAPIGGGMLYVKKNKVANLWPLFAESPKAENDILRLNHTGTKPVHTDLGIAHAIEYHEKLGAERKEARLRFLQNYWTNKVRKLPHIQLNTPEDPKRSCAIANVNVKGMKPHNLAKVLFDKYKIWTVAINRPGVVGCRITPNVYTSTDELDKFVKALTELG